jgi:hypothetical protein
MADPLAENHDWSCAARNSSEFGKTGTFSTVSGLTRPSFSVVGWERVHPYHRPQYSKLCGAAKKADLPVPRSEIRHRNDGSADKPGFDLIANYGLF